MQCHIKKKTSYKRARSYTSVQYRTACMRLLSTSASPPPCTVCMAQGFWGWRAPRVVLKSLPAPLPYKDNPLRALANKNMALCQRADSVSYFSASRQNLNYVRVSAVLYSIGEYTKQFFPPSFSEIICLYRNCHQKITKITWIWYI